MEKVQKAERELITAAKSLRLVKLLHIVNVNNSKNTF